MKPLACGAEDHVEVLMRSVDKLDTLLGEPLDGCGDELNLS